MFRVSDTKEVRLEKIKEYADGDIAVGVLVAAANFEWTLFRTFRVVASVFEDELDEEHLAGLKRYKKYWDEKIGACSIPHNQSLKEVANEGVKCPDPWKKGNCKSKYLEWHAGDRESGWRVLAYAMECRNHLIHGQKGGLDVEYGRIVIDVINAAFLTVVSFAEKDGFDLFADLRKAAKR